MSIYSKNLGHKRACGWSYCRYRQRKKGILTQLTKRCDDWYHLATISLKVSISTVLAMADNTVRQDINNLLHNLGVRKASVVEMAGANVGKTYELAGEPLFIGRSAECGVSIDDDQVSREHAKIERSEEGFVIVDLNSTNGTLVNGVAIESHLLQDGDRLQIGTFTVLKFNYQDEFESAFNEELYNSANRDYLTQAYNKKYLTDRLRMEFSYAKRHETDLSLVMFDIDFFKQINDQHGHLAGDEILRLICQRVTELKREEDVFARFGGEEFLMLLRGADGQTAEIIAEKIRHSVADEPFVVQGKEIDVTISLGVASLMDSDCKNIEGFLLEVDNQLYRAKREGRNRTCI